MAPSDEPGDVLLREWCAFRASHSPAEVEALARRLRALVWRHRARALLRGLLPLLLLAALACGVAWAPAARTAVFTAARLTVVHSLLPLMDLPRLARAPCLLHNPGFDRAAVALVPGECTRCTGLRRPVAVDAANLTARTFARDFAEQDSPLLVRGGAAGWPLASLSVQALHDLYVHDPQLRATLACSLVSSVRLPYGNNKLLLRTLLNERPGRWFALWQHCSLAQTKTFRRLYRRPPFIPDGLCLGGPELHSWLLLGQNPRQDVPTYIEFSGNYFFLGQARGRSRVHLAPRQPCDQEGCAPIELELGEGDLLVVTDMWHLAAVPTGRALSMALGFPAEA